MGKISSRLKGPCSTASAEPSVDGRVIFSIRGYHARASTLLILGVLAALAVAYFWLAKATTASNPMIIADFIDRTPIFRVDDGYRFFVARSAWSQISLYAWNYVLPVCVLLDGVLASILSNDLFLMRCAHIVPALMTIWFTYKAGLGLGINGFLMAVSVLILALMPLYAFVFLSFYGENWLTLFSSALLCSFVYRRYMLAACIASLMPLIRPEGIFFLIPVMLFLLKEKNFKGCLVIIFPGALHFLSLFLILDNISDYFSWRVWFRYASNVVYSADVYANYMLSTFNPLWTLPALAAFVLPAMRRLWPIWLGACLWLASVGLSLASSQAYYEGRYLLSVLPVITVAWPLFIVWLSAQPVFRHARVGWLAILSLFLGFIILEHMLQMDPLRARYGDGERWPFPGRKPLVQEFLYYPEDELTARNNMASVIYELIRKNPEIDSLVIYSDNIFRVLNPDKIPPRVRVSLAPMSGDISLGALENNFYTMHPDGHQYTIFNFKTLNVKKKSPVVLYVGDLFCQLCVPVFSGGGYSLYALAYDDSLNIKRIPPKNISLSCVRSKEAGFTCR